MTGAGKTGAAVVGHADVDDRDAVARAQRDVRLFVAGKRCSSFKDKRFDFRVKQTRLSFDWTQDKLTYPGFSRSELTK